MRDKSPRNDWIVGVDAGGTFTDFSARNVVSGERHVHKRLSTPDDPGRAILDGLTELQAIAGIDGAAISRFAHGTTVATNALLQRKGARVAVLTTAGFRDLLEIGRQVRPALYDLQQDAPEPLAPRHRRLEVAERIGAAGEVVTPLADAEIDRVLAELATLDDVQSVAVCLLFSFRNPDHEQRLAGAIRQSRPDLHVSASSEVQPEFREYERFSTTLVNAFLQPEVGCYIANLREAIAARAPNARVGIFQSSGGLMSVGKAATFPVRTALSGPAAGAVGAAAAGAAAAVGDIVTLDIGGTSTDVALIRGGSLDIAHMREIAGFRIRLPGVDINTVGAGGGSIARIAPDGLMRVGPESAGAVPGPACYGKGGTRPTVTDANVYLGRLPAVLAGGSLGIDRDKAAGAIERIAGDLGITPVRAALGIVDIATSNMMRAIRAVSTERGHDPRDCTLMPFGGAGGLHAADVAAALGIRRILVPRAPGILCADGLLEADLEEHFVATVPVPLHGPLPAVAAAFEQLTAAAHNWLADEAAAAVDPRVGASLDMRYIGQNYELPITIGDAGLDRDDLKRRFLAAHEQAYGHANPDAPIEIVNLRLRAAATWAQAVAPEPGATGDGRPTGHARVWFRETGTVSTPIHARADLPVGLCMAGPAIVTQPDATTLVPPGMGLTVDPARNLLLEA